MNQEPLFPELVKGYKPKVVSSLSPDTPQQKQLFAELGHTFKAMGRGAPQKFSTIQQKDAFQNAAEALGEEFPSLLNKALEAGRSSLAGVVRYVQSCAKSRATSDKEQETVVSMPWVD